MQTPIPEGTRVHILTDDEHDGKTGVVKYSPAIVIGGDTEAARDHLIAIDGEPTYTVQWFAYRELMIVRDQPATNHGAF